MSELAGRHALITGGLGSIGSAIAAACVGAGARVTVLDRPGLSCPADYGWIGADLNDPAHAAALVAAAGPFDVLVNNAALIINKPHEAFTYEEYEDQQRVNAGSAFMLARAVTPRMKENCWGRIINLTSITLNGQWTGYVPYTASKGTLVGLTKGLARELGPYGITVNAISPGAVMSDAENRVFGDRMQVFTDWVLDHQSIKRRIMPADIASLAVYLASDGAAMISGQNIAVDGGW